MNSYRIPIPGFNLFPLKDDDDRCRKFVFELACWWFESLAVNLAQFLQVAAACHCIILVFIIIGILKSIS